MTVGWNDPYDAWDIELIGKAAHLAKQRAHCHPRMFIGDPYETAWGGVAVAIAENPECSWYDAVDAGAKALQAEMYEQLKTVPDGKRKTAARSALWWNEYNARAASADTPGKGLDAKALEQVLDALPDRHQLALAAYAATLSVDACAELWGVKYATAMYRITVAREAALALLFDHETPPKKQRLSMGKKQDRTHCAKGHDWAVYGVERKRKTPGKSGIWRRHCRECDRLAQAEKRKERKAA